jgi:tetratricopeptide (TPR) repeat protein
MRLSPRHNLVAAAVLLALGGCQTASLNVPNPFTAASTPPASDTTGSIEGGAAPETTGTVPPLPGSSANPDQPWPGDAMAPKKALLGADQYDDLAKGRIAYRDGNYGLAEQHFRRATEQSVNDADAWLGLAASYDRLKRFDLADRAYKNLIRLTGPTAEVLNNIGYSYILRGDYANARVKLAEASRIDPGNPYVRSNIEVLERAIAQRKGVR